MSTYNFLYVHPRIAIRAAITFLIQHLWILGGANRCEKAAIKDSLSEPRWLPALTLVTCNSVFATAFAPKHI